MHETLRQRLLTSLVISLRSVLLARLTSLLSANLVSVVLIERYRVHHVRILRVLIEWRCLEKVLCWLLLFGRFFQLWLRKLLLHLVAGLMLQVLVPMDVDGHALGGLCKGVSGICFPRPRHVLR